MHACQMGAAACLQKQKRAALSWSSSRYVLLKQIPACWGLLLGVWQHRWALAFEGWSAGLISACAWFLQCYVAEGSSEEWELKGVVWSTTQS